uniref:Uncharacterized protein n=1 Tax=Wuchereria bancrofti TaxID=6293 RepID=A0AAF5PRF7_WUCBA
MTHFTKLKLLNESYTIDDDSSVYALRTCHNSSGSSGSSSSSSYDENTMIESNETFSNFSISSIVNNKLKSSIQNQTGDNCSENSIYKIALTQSSENTSDDLKSSQFDEEMSQLSQLSQPCYTAHVFLSEEITDLGFNYYQILDDQLTSQQSNKSEETNILSESNIKETNDSATPKSTTRSAKSVSKATESSDSLNVNSEYCIARMNETSAMINTGTSSIYFYKETDPFQTLYNTDEAQWSSFIPQ